ncbi:unnamed protein product [Linum trigynum]|uniref:Uncharacterized protein n=1 Tax=Linum trigynum TaxID=586398 RepID=A0AAV2CXF8_9ROSI
MFNPLIRNPLLAPLTRVVGISPISTLADFLCRSCDSSSAKWWRLFFFSDCLKSLSFCSNKSLMPSSPLLFDQFLPYVAPFESLSLVFLPRAAEQATILDESDLWILFNAKTSCPISYASLMFNHIIKYQDEECSGKLPFGPQITYLLAILRVDLRGKITKRDVHSDLQAQHVLRRTLSALGPRKLAKVQGGDKSAQSESEPESEPNEDDNTAALSARLGKGKEVAESSGKRKRGLNMRHLQEGIKLEKEGKVILHDLTVALKGKEASSSGKKVNKVLFLPSENEEDDPSEYASSPDYTY